MGEIHGLVYRRSLVYHILRNDHKNKSVDIEVGQPLTEEVVNIISMGMDLLHDIGLETFNKIGEKAHLIIPSQQLKEYLSSLEKNGLVSFQKREFIEPHTKE